MAGVVQTKDRFALAVGALCLIAAVVAGPTLLLLRRPVAFALASSFATPVVLAALAFGARWAYAAVRGRARLPKPQERRGSLEPRPFSPAQRRRPRT